MKKRRSRRKRDEEEKKRKRRKRRRKRRRGGKGGREGGEGCLIQVLKRHGGKLTTDYRITVQHLECKCSCKVKKRDCTKHQVYDGNFCECYCPNRKKDCSPNKHWSDKNCSCVCNQDTACSTGIEQDQTTCKCPKQKH
ncbi:balbiani ring protein 3-like [Macrosteles quadrilineatus]|uniref:balbiani ring protein 3-like n=1 Tax=Macrosteles quadrilineatus TaxID=74068 RepID=UPI0023E2BC21|nr:balbiani ring protein 3-like [Macrosteles quadrilineatus]